MTIREEGTAFQIQCMLKRERFENGYLEMFSSQGVLITENSVNMSPIKNSTKLKKKLEKCSK